jgi:hypothetical protein
MADNGINKAKGRRSIKNRTYYAAMPAKVAAKKVKKATKAKAKKDADIKKDLKKNGKPVKGGKTYKELAAEKLRKMKATEEAANAEAAIVDEIQTTHSEPEAATEEGN